MTSPTRSRRCNRRAAQILSRVDGTRPLLTRGCPTAGRLRLAARAERLDLREAKRNIKQMDFHALAQEFTAANGEPKKAGLKGVVLALKLPVGGAATATGASGQPGGAGTARVRWHFGTRGSRLLGSGGSSPLPTCKFVFLLPVCLQPPSQCRDPSPLLPTPSRCRDPFPSPPTCPFR